MPSDHIFLIHPANDAKKELKGCIAPVSILTAEGKGLRSRIARDKLHAIVYPELEKETKVFITIKSNKHEADTKSQSTDTKVTNWVKRHLASLRCS